MIVFLHPLFYFIPIVPLFVWPTKFTGTVLYGTRFGLKLIRTQLTSVHQIMIMYKIIMIFFLLILFYELCVAVGK